MRRKRNVGLEQVTGVLLMFGAALLYIHPGSLTFVWLTAAYGVEISIQFLSFLWLVCGWLMAWTTDTSDRLYFILTAPLLLYVSPLLWYALATAEASPVPGYLGVISFIALQYIHARREEFSRWKQRLMG